MTTHTLPRNPRAARPAAPAPGLLAALADIPRERVRVYVAGVVVDLLVALAVMSVVWGL